MFKAVDTEPGEKLVFNDAEYTKETLDKAVQLEFNKLAGSHKAWRENRDLIFNLLEETVDHVFPKRVVDSLNQFAEVKTVGHGEKIVFTRKEGRVRGRNFVTQVAHAGLYEVFKLDRSVFDMPVTAMGGAVLVSIEEVLEGRVDLNELVQIITEGYEEAVYREILRQMVALNSNSVLPANNVRSANGWDPMAFTSLLGISRAYGTPTIFCSENFAASMIPHAGMATESQKQELVDKGFIGRFNGANVVVIPHSFYNTSNEADAVTLPLGLAWILPSGTGLDQKPVKIAFEGDTLAKPIENDDWSKEIHFYKKMGVMLMTNPGMCVYENTALSEWPEVSGPIITFPQGETEAKFTRLV